jgi:hypothetical protein
MIDIPENPAIGQILTLLKPLGKGIALQAGEVVEALVVDLFPSGGLTLKVKGSYLPVRSDLVFEKNDTLSLKVIGLQEEKGEFTLQLLGDKVGSKGMMGGPIIPETDRERIEGLIQKISDLIPGLSDKKITKLQSIINETEKILQTDSSVKAPRIKGIIQDFIFSRLQDINGPEEKARPLLSPDGLPQKTEDQKNVPNPSTEGSGERVEKGQTSGVVAPSLNVGRLRVLLENLLKALPADSQSLPRELRSQILQVLQASLKEPNQGPLEKITQMIKQLPEEITVPFGFRDLLGKNLIPMEGLRATDLKNVLESSGVILEARLKALIEKTIQGAQSDVVVSNKIQHDLKAFLLKLKEAIQEKTEIDSSPGLFKKLLNEVETVREGEIRPYEAILGKVDALLKDVETFQLLSKITDSFYTFLPVQWIELKRGELILKRRRIRSGGQGYSCSIHLDLERVGSVSVFLFMQQKDFYITFKVEQPGLGSLIHSHLGQLKETFDRSGLNLKSFSFLRESDSLQDPFDRIATEETIVNIRI